MHVAQNNIQKRKRAEAKLKKALEDAAKAKEEQNRQNNTKTQKEKAEVEKSESKKKQAAEKKKAQGAEKKQRKKKQSDEVSNHPCHNCQHMSLTAVLTKNSLHCQAPGKSCTQESRVRS